MKLLSMDGIISQQYIIQDKLYFNGKEKNDKKVVKRMFL